MPSISIIIPVYNIENYIEQCVNSILSQSFGDYEIILVNDGSTDGSAHICDGLARKNNKIKVFHQENKGVSVARNLGIDNAKGKWITFVDGDDSVYKDSLVQISNMLDFDDDILVFNSFVESKNGNKHYRYNHINELIDGHFNPKELFKQYGYTRGSVCGCLYNNAFIQNNKIRFARSIKNSEDTLFFRVVMYFASKIYFANIDFYEVYEREGSASRSWDRERVLKYVDSLNCLEPEVAKYGISYSKEPLFNYFTYGLISNLYNQYVRTPKDKSIQRLLKQQIKSSKLYPIDIKGIPILRNKIRILNMSIDLFQFLVRLKK